MSEIPTVIGKIRVATAFRADSACSKAAVPLDNTWLAIAAWMPVERRQTSEINAYINIAIRRLRNRKR